MKLNFSSPSPRWLSLEVSAPCSGCRKSEKSRCFCSPELFLFSSFADDQHGAEGAELDYDSDNSDCDSIATYSSGEPAAVHLLMIWMPLGTLGGKHLELFVGEHWGSWSTLSWKLPLNWTNIYRLPHPQLTSINFSIERKTICRWFDLQAPKSNPSSSLNMLSFEDSFTHQKDIKKLRTSLPTNPLADPFCLGENAFWLIYKKCRKAEAVCTADMHVRCGVLRMCQTLLCSARMCKWRRTNGICER